MNHAPGFLALVDDAKTRVREIDVAAAKALVDGGATLIDVREDNEWAAGYAAFAVHLGRGVLERDVEAQYPDKGTQLLLYCGGGFRSALAADNLQKMGYTDVWSVAGGFKAWEAAGYSVVR